MASLTLATLRQRVLDKLLETANNSHFTSSQLNNYINEAVEYTAVFVEYQRTLYTVQAVQGQQTYALPSDDLYIRTAYFGDKTALNDIKPLIITNEEYLKDTTPAWLDTTTQTQGRPTYLIIQDRNTMAVWPIPDQPNSVIGKLITLNYNQVPPVLVNDSDIPALPLAYNNLIQIYALHLCYTALLNKDMSQLMFDQFNAKLKLIKPAIEKETKEGLRFDWGFDDGVNIGTDIINPQ